MILRMRNFNPQHLPHLRLPVGPNHVLQVAKEAGVTLSKVLTTHHQWDHAGGNADLWKCYQADPSLGILSIYDGNDDRINNMTNTVGQDDTLENGTVPHNVPHLVIHRDLER
uniref:Hydroxyacylglutathione hydrolase, mitochondrial n=1 Tax=Culex pipiens TaxID=7175 RepID=A0A8D8KJI1_CULPI